MNDYQIAAVTLFLLNLFMYLAVRHLSRRVNELERKERSRNATDRIRC